MQPPLERLNFCGGMEGSCRLCCQPSRRGGLSYQLSAFN